jgi:hypothetical protein
MLSVQFCLWCEFQFENRIVPLAIFRTENDCQLLGQLLHVVKRDVVMRNNLH